MKIGITKRHHWPAMISGFDFTPKLMSVSVSVVLPMYSINKNIVMLTARKMNVNGVRRLHME